MWSNSQLAAVHAVVDITSPLVLNIKSFQFHKSHRNNLHYNGSCCLNSNPLPSKLLVDPMTLFFDFLNEPGRRLANVTGDKRKKSNRPYLFLGLSITIQWCNNVACLSSFNFFLSPSCNNRKLMTAEKRNVGVNAYGCTMAGVTNWIMMPMPHAASMLPCGGDFEIGGNRNILDAKSWHDISILYFNKVGPVSSCSTSWLGYCNLEDWNAYTYNCVTTSQMRPTSVALKTI